MKPLLNEILRILEETATSVAALETALIQSGHLQEGAVDQYQAAEQPVQHQNLARLRSLIAAIDG